MLLISTPIDNISLGMFLAATENPCTGVNRHLFFSGNRRLGSPGSHSCSPALLRTRPFLFWGTHVGHGGSSLEFFGEVISGDLHLHHIGKNCVCPPPAARGPVFSSGHMAALESSWCWISKKEGRTGPGLALQCVPQNAIIIPPSLFGCNPFDNRSHKVIVHHVALLNSFSFKVTKLQKS